MINGKIIIGVILFICIVLSGCSSPQFNIIGDWKDATGMIQTYDKDGTCVNVSVTAYFNSESSKSKFSLSNSPNDEGFYTLSVQEASSIKTKFKVKVINDDKIELYFNDDNVPLYDKVPVYRLTRQ